MSTIHATNPHPLFNFEQWHWPSVRSFAHKVMFVSATCFLISIIISYPLAEAFSLPAQISAHIASILFPAFFKLGYVLRCLAHKQLGLEV